MPRYHRLLVVEEMQAYHYHRDLTSILLSKGRPWRGLVIMSSADGGAGGVLTYCCSTALCSYCSVVVVVVVGEEGGFRGDSSHGYHHGCDRWNAENCSMHGSAAKNLDIIMYPLGLQRGGERMASGKGYYYYRE